MVVSKPRNRALKDEAAPLKSETSGATCLEVLLELESSCMGLLTSAPAAEEDVCHVQLN